MRSRGIWFDAVPERAPYLLLFPALAISLTILALNLIGDGLRDALDPRLRGR